MSSPARAALAAAAAAAAAGSVCCFLYWRRSRKGSGGPETSRLLRELPRFSASASPTEVAAALHSHGVAVIERLAPEAAMDKLVKQLEEASGVFYGQVGSFAGHHTTRNAGKPLGESEVAQELATNSLVVAVCEKMMLPWCKRINLGTCSAISVEPPPKLDEPPAPPQVLHRDESMWGASGWEWLPSTPLKGRPEFSVSVNWAVTDFTKENGATRFLPGSNHWQRVAADYDSSSDGGALPPGISEADTIQAVAPKGSAILWSGGTIHGAGGHAPRQPADDVKPSIRRGLVFIYNLGWLKPEHNLHWAMPLSVMKGFSPKLSELVGRAGENGAEHDWFTGPVYTQPYLGGPNGSTSGEGVQF